MSQRFNLRSLGMFVGVALCATLPAQANAPPGHYTAGMGMVSDNKTTLTWQQAAPTIGGDSGNGEYTWSNAKSYCAALSLNGSGWRLPTVKELVSLVDVTKQSPCIDTSANGFPATPAAAFWSATPLASSPLSEAWGVAFTNGYAYHEGVAAMNRVRCVR